MSTSTLAAFLVSPVVTFVAYLEFDPKSFRKAVPGLLLSGFDIFVMLYFQPVMAELTKKISRCSEQASYAMSMVLARLKLVFGACWSAGNPGWTLRHFVGCAGDLWGRFHLSARCCHGLSCKGSCTRFAGKVMVHYLGGNAMSAAHGRLIALLLATGQGEREVAAEIAAVRIMPGARRFMLARSSHVVGIRRASEHLSEAWMERLFVSGFLLVSAFVSDDNYLAFFLFAPPMFVHLSVQGLVLLLCFFGMCSSAWGGRLSGGLGRRQTLWAMVCAMENGLLESEWNNGLILAYGTAMVAWSFFVACSIACGRIVGRTRESCALAASLCLTGCCRSSNIPGFSPIRSAAWNVVVKVRAAVLPPSLSAAPDLRHLTRCPV